MNYNVKKNKQKKEKNKKYFKQVLGSVFTVVLCFLVRLQQLVSSFIFFIILFNGKLFFCFSYLNTYISFYFSFLQPWLRIRKRLIRRLSIQPKTKCSLHIPSDQVLLSTFPSSIMKLSIHQRGLVIQLNRFHNNFQ